MDNHRPEAVADRIQRPGQFRKLRRVRDHLAPDFEDLARFAPANPCPRRGRFFQTALQKVQPQESIVRLVAAQTIAAPPASSSNSARLPGSAACNHRERPRHRCWQLERNKSLQREGCTYASTRKSFPLVRQLFHIHGNDVERFFLGAFLIDPNPSVLIESLPPSVMKTL